MKSSPDTIGCYVHIPFCVRKCAYCDFNSFSGYTDGSIARYVAALTQKSAALLSSLEERDRG